MSTHFFHQIALENIPFNTLVPQHDASIAEALLAVLKDSRFILGDRLTAFESQFAEFTGVRHCMGTGNGHDALVLALRSLGICEYPSEEDASVGDSSGLAPSAVDLSRSKVAQASRKTDRSIPGAVDEVLVPANTYIATWLAVTNAGCIPVPVEPDPLTHNIDPARIEERISSRTKAILPVHLYGNPCDMGQILAIARKHNLKVVEDNAQAHGATFSIPGSAGSHPAQLTGSFGDANATSFYPSKNLGALGDGGAVTTNDDAIAARLARIRNYGFSSKGVCDEVGINSRLDELQAAVLSVKLKRLNFWNNERRSIARIYDENLRGVGDLLLPVPTPRGTHVYHLYIVRTGRREKLREHLGKEGIQTMVHYPVPPHLQKAYAGLGYRRGSLPVSEQLADEVVSLPLWPGMKEEEVARVWKAVRGFFGG